MMFNLQQRRWDLFVDWFDWFSSKQRRFFIVESIDRFDSWAIHEDSYRDSRNWMNFAYLMSNK